VPIAQIQKIVTLGRLCPKQHHSQQLYAPCECVSRTAARAGLEKLLVTAGGNDGGDDGGDDGGGQGETEGGMKWEGGRWGRREGG